MKIKTIYVCQTCQYENPKWIGKCPSCNNWNSFIEQEKVVNSSKISQTRLDHPVSTIQKITLSGDQNNRLKTSLADFNTTLGGGIKSGSLILLSGEPGIGKSTLTMQICKDLANLNQNILYCSGEESVDQVSSRASRLKINSDQISLVNESNLENLLLHLEKKQFNFLIIDSIQVLYSNDINSISGSLNQVRYCTEKIMEYTKRNGLTTLIIGHVNKDGNLAGPKMLEHLVDTVLFIEGDRYHNFRTLRCLKNRFGSTSEITLLEMQGDGLREINNPSEIFLEGRKENSIGSALTITIEGSKPIILEVQALTNSTIFGYPKRTASGFDLNRLQLLSAVIQRFLGINLNAQDIFTNVVGGFRLQEPAADLSIAMAIISSQLKQPLPGKTIFLGEIGLSGEIRKITSLEKRIKEAEKLGFDTIVTARSKEKINSTKVKIFPVSDLQEAFKLFFTSKSKN